MNTGDTAFMLIATALVFFMTPGLAFFYGGLVRRKNVCNTMMACVAISIKAVSPVFISNPPSFHLRNSLCE